MLCLFLVSPLKTPSPIPLREEQTVAGQRITTLHARGKLTPSQQNQLIRQDPEIPQLLELLQEVLSRPLTPYETEGFLYLYSGLRLSASYLLLAAQYSREIGKDSIRQIERLGTRWGGKRGGAGGGGDSAPGPPPEERGGYTGAVRHWGAEALLQGKGLHRALVHRPGVRAGAH